MFLFLLSFKLLSNSTLDELMQIAKSSSVHIFVHQIPPISNFEKVLSDNWESFTQSNEEKTSDYIVDIDFNQNREFSISFDLHQTNVPTFIILSQESPKIYTKSELFDFFHKPDFQLSNSNFFSNLIGNSEIGRKSYEMNCSPFNITNALFPAFVFSAPISRACSLSTRFKHLYPHIADHFYYLVDKDHEILTFYFNQTETIQHSIQSSRKSLIREYRFFPFHSSWSVQNIRQFKRNVVFIVYSDQVQYPLYSDDNADYSSENQKIRQMINDINGMFWRNFVFNKMTYKQFRNCFSANVYQTPFLIISDSTKSAFTAITNITLSKRDTIIETIQHVENGDLDDDMPFTFEPLLPKINAPFRKPRNQLAFTLFAFSVIILTAFLITRKADECINPNSYRYKKQPKNKSNYSL